MLNVLSFVTSFISIFCSIYVVIIANRMEDNIFKKWIKSINLNTEVIDLNKQILERNREIIDNYVIKESSNA